MWEKIKNTALIVLATLGVLFIIIMFLPEDEEEAVEGTVAQETVAENREDGENGQAAPEASPETENGETAAGEVEPIPATGEAPAATEATAAVEDNNAPASGDGNTVTVSIPPEELSSGQIRFRSITLDDQEVTQDIFSDYDLTLVHVWGTFCGPCIAEMGEYASLYKSLPSNVNMIAMVCDVYDGIDSNVSEAKKILSANGAEFLNIRTSDDVYNLTGNLQFVPSSFFVDREGHLVGSMMDGAGFSETKSRLEGYLAP